MMGGCCQRNGGFHSFGMIRRPLQHLHATHRPAGDTEQLVNAQVINQFDLGLHHIAHRDNGKAQAIVLSRCRVNA